MVAFRTLYNDCFHEWKSIPLHLTTMLFVSKFKFSSNIYFKKISLKKLLPFYKGYFILLKTFFSPSPETPACILSQFWGFNKYIQIEYSPVYLTKFPANNIDFYSQLFEEGNLKLCNDLKVK